MVIGSNNLTYYELYSIDNVMNVNGSETICTYKSTDCTVLGCNYRISAIFIDVNNATIFNCNTLITIYY